MCNLFNFLKTNSSFSTNPSREVIALLFKYKVSILIIFKIGEISVIAFEFKYNSFILVNFYKFSIFSILFPCKFKNSTFDILVI